MSGHGLAMDLGTSVVWQQMGGRVLCFWRMKDWLPCKGTLFG